MQKACWKFLFFPSRFLSVLVRSTLNMSTFVQRISPVTGKPEWVLQDESYDYHQEIARSAYADMLHDTERNKKYYVALKEAIHLMHERGKEANVLDIGTGTGLLSMMAVSCGADTVTACEAFTPMAKCAKKVIEDNDCGGKIHLIQKRSNEITVGPGCDMPFRANILVTEVFDTELIGEGAIPTFHHAHQQLLEKDCIVVPSAANMYVQVIHSDLARSWRSFRSVPLENDDEIRVPAALLRCPGTPSVHDIQMSQLPQDLFTPLTKPVTVFRFDYSGSSTIDFEGHSVQTVDTVAGGRGDAVLMWWDLQMDTRGDVMLSCAPVWAHPKPDELQWRDHWMQAVYYPQHHLEVEKGEQIMIHSCHDNYSLWFDVALGNQSSSPPDPPACRCGAHMACGWSRIGMMNDCSRNNKYIDALSKVVTEDTVCLSISDGSLLPLIAAKLGAKKVYALETQPMTRRMTEKYLDENQLRNKVTVLNKAPEEITAQDMNGQQINLIVGEPVFATTTLPWHNLLFWYARTEIQDVLNEDCIVIPWVASVKAVAVDFTDLWKIRAPIENCEGFKMTHFDKMIEGASELADTYLEPQPLWEYPGKPLTDQFDILHLDFSRPLTSIKTVEREGFIEFWSSGRCSGVAVWMDFHLDKKNTIKTGLIEPPVVGETLKWDIHTRQAVHIIPMPVSIPDSQQHHWRLKHKVFFKPKTGDLQFKFDIVNLAENGHP